MQLCTQQAWHTRNQHTFVGALLLSLQAIDQVPEDAQERAVYLCNAAACYLKKQDWQLACEQCTAALKINGSYLKVRDRLARMLLALCTCHRPAGCQQ